MGIWLVRGLKVIDEPSCGEEDIDECLDDSLLHKDHWSPAETKGKTFEISTLEGGEPMFFKAVELLQIKGDIAGRSVASGSETPAAFDLPQGFDQLLIALD